MKLGRWSVVAPSALLLVAAVLATVLIARPAQSTAGTLQSAKLESLRIPGPCEGGATKPFTPTSIDIEHIRKDLPIMAKAREYADVPGVPPVSATYTVAWDAPGPKPGSASGLVRFNAHTWPNGAALGNAMLAKFHVGDTLMLRDKDDHKLCYRVTKRVEVSAYATYEPFFELDGPSQFAFIVCSGQRLGPGNWNKRTVWWGKPI